MAITKIEEDITALWARLNPVAGYTSGRAADIKSLFLPTEKEVQDANTAIGSLKKRTGEITDPGLKTTADKQLDLLATQLAYPQPGMGVQDCGDGAFYITLLHGRPFSRPSPEPWLQGFLGSAAQKIALETERLMPLSLQGTPRQQCLSAAAYCRETMAILKKQFPTADITEVDSHLTAFEKVVSAPGLGSDDFGVMFQALRETTTSPVYTEGYPPPNSSPISTTSPRARPTWTSPPRPGSNGTCPSSRSWPPNWPSC
ncbi:hypothetical protein ACFY7Z_10825 [Streptomyces sp. NPDC012623]|uniref:hypothetical protein n=1 Tax=unclassified Streptomyces TaxID=2593676 RepID=UPI00367EAFCE